MENRGDQACAEQRRRRNDRNLFSPNSPSELDWTDLTADHFELWDLSPLGHRGSIAEEYTGLVWKS